MRILLIEDDHVLGSAIENHFQDLGHGIDRTRRLEDASAALETVVYDILFLDLNLPDGSGVNFLKKLRLNQTDAPVIVVTAQDQVQPRIEALRMGADDFLVKPFDLDELLARAEAVVRRSVSSKTRTSINGVTVDIGRKRIQRNEEDILLTSKEWVVLDCLLRNRGAVVSKDKIEDNLYSFGSEVESNAVEVFVSRIRKKLGTEAIKTVRGLGYLAVTDE